MLPQVFLAISSGKKALAASIKVLKDGGEGLGSPKVLVDRDPAAQPTGLNSPVNVLDSP